MLAYVTACLAASTFVIGFTVGHLLGTRQAYRRFMNALKK